MLLNVDRAGIRRTKCDIASASHINSDGVVTHIDLGYLLLWISICISYDCWDY